MNRMLAAIALAVLLHCGLFLADFDWLRDGIVPPHVSQFVTVTMSYRQKAAKTNAAAEDESEEQHEIVGSEKTATRAIQQKRANEKSAVKPLESHTAKAEVSRDSEDDRESDAERSTEERSVDAGMVQEAVPLYRINPPPRYPRTARRRGTHGTVMLSVYVDAQGSVANLWVFESSGSRVLDSAALEAVKKWSFEPGRKGNAPVAMWVNVPVRFELQ